MLPLFPIRFDAAFAYADAAAIIIFISLSPLRYAADAAICRHARE